LSKTKRGREKHETLPAYSLSLLLSHHTKATTKKEGRTDWGHGTEKVLASILRGTMETLFRSTAADEVQNVTCLWIEIFPEQMKDMW
jgi:hypothetical protein